MHERNFELKELYKNNTNVMENVNTVFLNKF